jgi:hypothetical protein
VLFGINPWGLFLHIDDHFTMTFELHFNLSLETLQPPQKKKRNELWKTLFHERVASG